MRSPFRSARRSLTAAMVGLQGHFLPWAGRAQGQHGDRSREPRHERSTASVIGTDSRPEARALRLRFGAALLAALLTGGCVAKPATSGDPARHAAAPGCAPRTRPALVLPPLVGDLRGAAGGVAAAAFSPGAVDTADAIGALGPLRRLVELDAGALHAATDLRRLRLRQTITDRILLAMLDVSSSIAEINCEGERGNELRDRLRRIEESRARRLNLATIMVGALTAVVSGGLSLAGAAGGDIAGIVGGTAEAGVATTLLFGSASGELRTERNLLSDVWNQREQSSLFPATVWRLLTRRPGNEPNQPSVAERLRAEWQAGERLGPAGSQEERDRISLLFGPGGLYTVEDLELRDATVDLLQASISLMNQDLRGLLEELLGRPREAVPAPEASRRRR